MQCKNCHLYNRRTQACHITIINAGEYYELPVAPNDDCHWERLEAEVNAALQEAIDQETDPVKKKVFIGTATGNHTQSSSCLVRWQKQLYRSTN